MEQTSQSADEVEYGEPKTNEWRRCDDIEAILSAASQDCYVAVVM